MSVCVHTCLYVCDTYVLTPQDLMDPVGGGASGMFQGILHCPWTLGLGGSWEEVATAGRHRCSGEGGPLSGRE